MVVKEKQALKATHRLLMQGRQLAFEGIPSQDFLQYFDELAGLLGYVIAWQGDRSEAFEHLLESVCAEAKAPHIFEEFKR